MIRYVVLLALAALAACEGTDPAAERAGDDADRAAQSATLEAEPDAEAEDAPDSAEWVLNAHYRRLAPTQPTSSSPTEVEVAEVFWYGCPHCNAFEPYLERWQASTPHYVSFVRIPAVWNPLLQLHARAFYTAKELGKLEEMHAEFFREIHERHNPLDTEERLAEFFGRFGVDRATFEQAFDSYAVHQGLQRAEELNRRYRIDSVPTIVVNGKYTSNATMAGDYDRLLSLVDFLAESEHTPEQRDGA
ncbi:MAG TPA: thiol:disulfide interchange protein DsbA/DsbL [Gammaproteobacteria bacterium]